MLKLKVSLGRKLTWPAMKSLRIMGSPLIIASAIVPGPACKRANVVGWGIYIHYIKRTTTVLMGDLPL